MSVETLFKYGSFGDYSESLFSNPSIWFSSPSNLNDPFECRAWFESNATDEQIVVYLFNKLRMRQPSLSLMDALTQALGLQKNGRHRDTRYWEYFRKMVDLQFAHDISICCLTTTNTNILMWSHYAKDHEGYCIEFAASNTTLFFGEAQKVSYSNDFPVIDFINTPPDTKIELMFLTKFEGWKYEEEYRIVNHQGGAGLYTYPASLLKSVTFGLRMPLEHQQHIRAWTQGRGHEVKFQKATIHDREFKIVPLEA